MGGALRIDRVKKLRDFAFIHYCKREDAETALERFDGMILDGCVIEVTWAKPPETQKQKLLLEKSPTACLYRQLNFDNLDHTFDLNMHQTSPIPNFSLFPRSNARQRMQVSSLSNISNTFAVTRPIQILGYLCAENSWGNPIFQISRIDSDPSEMFYVCWVIIPNIPVQARRFMSDKVCRSPEEAKHHAACYVLKKLGVTDADFPFIGSPPHSFQVSNSLSNMSKNYLSPNSTSFSKPVTSNLGFCSPAKNVSFQSLKNPMTSPHPYFFERGQGDAGGFLPNSAPMEAFTNDEIENCTPLLDPETPIEPNSILGLLSSLAAASNVDLPLFNKPKL